MGKKNHMEDKGKRVVEDVAAFPNNKKIKFVFQHNPQDFVLVFLYKQRRRRRGIRNQGKRYSKVALVLLMLLMLTIVLLVLLAVGIFFLSIGSDEDSPVGDRIKLKRLNLDM
ncbi:probable prolyl 4-hydroxylase 3 [Olea europaea subsp. europaea]|uniref:Probable prolyl 4-hydroxylase 3 n=1 Tax=Olea europaea subsp. europaea TaxID=158383 RepID=A0A8S0VHM1_OLEEU|nr:probable prolyl 4-hydroxylase 3 [Olea europaea subsp. europaea]